MRQVRPPTPAQPQYCTARDRTSATPHPLAHRTPWARSLAPCRVCGLVSRGSPLCTLARGQRYSPPLPSPLVEVVGGLFATQDTGTSAY